MTLVRIQCPENKEKTWHCHGCHGHRGTCFVLSIMVLYVMYQHTHPLDIVPWVELWRQVRFGLHAACMTWPSQSTCLTCVSSYARYVAPPAEQPPPPGYVAWSPLHHLLPKAVAAAEFQDAA